jgi:hypothetical protein
MLEAVGDAPTWTDDDGNVFFMLATPGGERPSRIDELPLPSGTPPNPAE